MRARDVEAGQRTERRKNLRRVGVVLVFVVAGCAAFDESTRDVRMSSEFGRKPGEPVSQAELLEDVQRFTSDFMLRIADRATPLEESPSAVVREAALRRVLVYESMALDIASGPLPELNLVDMLVFVSLSRVSCSATGYRTCSVSARNRSSTNSRSRSRSCGPR
jgi:hypothetical protein